MKINWIYFLSHYCLFLTILWLEQQDVKLINSKLIMYSLWHRGGR